MYNHPKYHLKIIRRYLLPTVCCLLWTANSFTQAYLSENHYKCCQAREVYNQLIQASGSDYKQPPVLKISKRKSRMAGYDPAGIIILEEQAYDVCMNQKDSLAALAWVIGHEFSHFFQKHGKDDHRMRSLLDANPQHRIQYFQEQEADKVGAFYALLAGFEIENVLENLFDDLYKTYNLTHSTPPNYRALSERKKSAQEALSFAQQLWTMHETAGYLFAIGEYEIALQYYKYLLEHLESPAIHNNAALTWLHYFVASHSNSKTDGFIYPFELANEQRLETFLKRDDFHRQWKEMAQQHLKQALLLNPNFFPAQLNQLCFLLLEKQPKEAIVSARAMFRQTADPKEEALLNIIQGIAFAQTNDDAQAKIYFRKAANSRGSQLEDIAEIAQHNLEVLEGNNNASIKNLVAQKSNRLDLPQLEDLTFSDKELGQEAYLSGLSKNEHQSGFLSKKEDHGIIALHRQWRSQNITLFFTQDKSSKAPKGIRPGLSTKAIEKKFGKARKHLLQNGLLMVYDKEQLFFKIKNGVVVTWGGWR